MLLDHSGLPIPSANEFILGRRQLRTNTLQRNLRELIPLFEWLESRRIDLFRRASEGQGFTEAEIVGSLLEALQRDRSLGKVTKIAVAPSTFNQRLLTTNAFLRWYFNTCLTRLPTEHRLRARILENQQNILKWCEGSYLSAAPVNKSGQRKGLDDKEQSFLMDCLDPANPDGFGCPEMVPPLKKGASKAQKELHRKKMDSWHRRQALRHRNYVAAMLMLGCGIRRGEVLSLRVEDIVISSKPQVNVVVRDPDPSDHRGKRPSIKRNGRPIPMGPKLARALDVYIMEWRGFLLDRADEDNEYLILNGDGSPLSLKRFNEVFQEIREAYPKDLPRHLYPHALRHSFSANIEAALCRVGMEEQNRAKALALLRGDSSLESQNTYIEAEVHRQASNVLTTYQEKIMLILEDVPF